MTLTRSSRYDPGRHPERTLERRNWVLRRMHDQGWLDDSRLAAVVAEPLCYSPPSAERGRSGADYFTEALRDEVARRFGAEELADAGYTVLTTLRLQDQAVVGMFWFWYAKLPNI